LVLNGYLVIPKNQLIAEVKVCTYSISYKSRDPSLLKVDKNMFLLDTKKRQTKKEAGNFNSYHKYDYIYIYQIQDINFTFLTSFNTRTIYGSQKNVNTCYGTVFHHSICNMISHILICVIQSKQCQECFRFFPSYLWVSDNTGW